ncbi:hypothetical protein ACFP7A_07515 [Sporolactobacillus kofuensis]|uniref:DUF3784 domain-containing protein n=1 Tax=Sporolactobacillus kofuensis TaxID=269672 RepID=A0ABW1WEB9_9BACL|nr:hypothetical protein [Sporolactobacillus kofuensis]MCO7175832.1 hypothetical protein [Sporolactobacillus kofuensis]
MFYIGLVLFIIVLLCMLIGFITFLRRDYKSFFLNFIFNEKAIALLQSEKSTPQALDRTANFVILQVAVFGMIFAAYLNLPSAERWDNMRHLILLGVVVSRFVFEWLIVNILKH